MKPDIRKVLAVLVSAGVLAASAARAEERDQQRSIPQRVKHGVVRAADATRHGVERGAKATVHGVKRGAEATRHGVETGAHAVARVAHRVADKL